MYDLTPFALREVFTWNELIQLHGIVENLRPTMAPGDVVTETPQKYDGYRKSNVLWIPKVPETDWLYSKLGSIAVTINNTMGWNFNITGMFENIQIAEYDSTFQGGYDWHIDVGPDALSKRKISICIQLTHESEYEGGQLEISMTREPRVASKSFNSGVVFPSFMLHRVTPVTKGRRKSLVLWISGPPFK